MARKLKCPNCGTTKHVVELNIFKRVDGKYVLDDTGFECQECEIMFGHKKGYED